MRKNRPKARQTCACKHNRYVIPRFNEIPESLRGLTTAYIKVLRPFDIDCRQYRREEQGYRVKSAMINLETSKLPVLEKIKAVENKNDQHRCMEAYNYLINSKQSSYKTFIDLREELIHSQCKLNIF